jgi:DNA-binding NarL/FixJ family response regulator
MKTLGTSTRILLVEDFKPHRFLITSLLAQNPDLDVVGEAEDGVEAVMLVQQLMPDVVLMDIGLPKLNGLDAARLICSLFRSTKVVFVTQENDVDIAKEAFRLGAWGYILKQGTGTELVEALSAILQGRRFLSSGLRDGWSTFISDTHGKPTLHRSFLVDG